jgi:hypothetical protein
MSLSERAHAGLAAAARWNPHGARSLLAILREHPAWVRHKDDRYGPLGVVLFGVGRRKEVAPGIAVPADGPPISEEALADCEALAREWMRGDFSVKELADALEELLRSTNGRGAPGG